MQLIFNSEGDTYALKAMELLDKESFSEKFSAKSIIEKLSNCDTPNSKKVSDGKNDENESEIDNTSHINSKNSVGLSIENIPNCVPNRTDDIVDKGLHPNVKNPKLIETIPCKKIYDSLKNESKQINSNLNIECSKLVKDTMTDVIQTEIHVIEDNPSSNATSENCVLHINDNLNKVVCQKSKFIESLKNINLSAINNEENKDKLCHDNIEGNNLQSEVDSENNEAIQELDSNARRPYLEIIESKKCHEVDLNKLNCLNSSSKLEVVERLENENCSNFVDPQNETVRCQQLDTKLSKDLDHNDSNLKYSNNLHMTMSSNDDNSINAINSDKIIVNETKVCITRDKQEASTNGTTLHRPEYTAKTSDIITKVDGQNIESSNPSFSNESNIIGHVKNDEMCKKVDNCTNTIEINDDSSQENDTCLQYEKSKTRSASTTEIVQNLKTLQDKNDENENNDKIVDVCNDNSNLILCKLLNNEENSNKDTITSSNSSKTLPNLSDNQEENQISYVSNILSDEEDSTLAKNETPKSDIQEAKKQFIDVEDDDDDIMLIDDETASKVDDISSVVPLQENKDLEKNNEIIDDKLETSTNISINKKDVVTVKNNGKELNTENNVNNNRSEERTMPSPKPLFSANILSTYKKNLAEMTRSDLEEFCILKIVESVVDRGNLGEIKSQLKKVGLSVEEHKNKVKMLTKQNQDLQVVLRSVQEELKRNAPITPLKITRSVGIQVLMSDKFNQKPLVSQQNSQTPAIVIKQLRSPVTPNKRTQKRTDSPLPIPVPRLVPAKNLSNNSVQNQTLSNKAPNINMSSASLRTSPLKPEKRAFSKTQGGSDTVDLTDDEPPQKVATKSNLNQAVRVISSQALKAQQHHQISGNPRQVYIPISGAQAPNVRTAQAYMLKTIGTQNIRTKVPPLRRLHPAPLPESVKQYQPSNWKDVPPAPEIKLSKIDNGIVISWSLDSFREDIHENIASYQIYAYQETPSPPSTNLWKKIGDVKALPLPMACTLTKFVPGYKYYFAVRAIDVRSRQGSFSADANIMLVNKPN